MDKMPCYLINTVCLRKEALLVLQRYFEKKSPSNETPRFLRVSAG